MFAITTTTTTTTTTNTTTTTSATDSSFNPYLNTFAAIWCIVIAVVGAIGNLLTLLAIPWAEKNLPILNLAMADFIYCVINFPLYSFTFFNKGWPWRDWTCQGFAAFHNWNAFASWMSIGVIALSRYDKGSRKILYRRDIWLTSRLCLVSFCYILLVSPIVVPSAIKIQTDWKLVGFMIYWLQYALNFLIYAAICLEYRMYYKLYLKSLFPCIFGANPVKDDREIFSIANVGKAKSDPKRGNGEKIDIKIDCSLQMKHEKIVFSCKGEIEGQCLPATAVIILPQNLEHWGKGPSYQEQKHNWIFSKLYNVINKLDFVFLFYSVVHCCPI